MTNDAAVGCGKYNRTLMDATVASLHTDEIRPSVTTTPYRLNWRRSRRSLHLVQLCTSLHISVSLHLAAYPPVYLSTPPPPPPPLPPSSSSLLRSSVSRFCFPGRNRQTTTNMIRNVPEHLNRRRRCVPTQGGQTQRNLPYKTKNHSVCDITTKQQ